MGNLQYTSISLKVLKPNGSRVRHLFMKYPLCKVDLLLMFCVVVQSCYRFYLFNFTNRVDVEKSYLPTVLVTIYIFVVRMKAS